MNCDDCRWKIERKECPWDFDYEDTDYAYDCVDFCNVRQWAIKEKSMKQNMVDAMTYTLFKDSSSNYCASVAISYTSNGYYVVTLAGDDCEYIIREAYMSRNVALEKYKDICDHIDRYVEDDYKKWSEYKEAKLASVFLLGKEKK